MSQALRIRQDWRAAAEFHAHSDFVVLVDTGTAEREEQTVRLYGYEFARSIREYRALTPIELSETGSSRIGPDPGVRANAPGRSPTGWIAVPLTLPDSVASVYAGLTGRSILWQIALAAGAGMVCLLLLVRGGKIHAAALAKLESLAAWGRDRERWRAVTSEK